MNIPNISTLFKPASQFLNTNAPAILTAFGAVGVVGTAVLTGKATFEAAEILRDARLQLAEDHVRENGPLTDADYDSIRVDKVDAFKLVWLNYLPAATAGVLSVGAIIFSHRISSRRAAVLAAAYALNEGKLEEYQEKVKEKLGIKKEKDLRDELAQEQVNSEYNEGTVIFSPLDGKVMLRDEYSGRFFWSTVDEVNRAVNDINHEITKDSYCRLSEFYDLLGLDHISTSDYFGWNTHERLQVDWSTCTTPDGKIPVHSFSFVNPPVMNPGDGASFR